MSKKFYSDDDLITGLELMAEEFRTESFVDEVANVEMLESAVERIKQKAQQINFMRCRLDTAAEWIGHQTITDMMDERGY